MKRCVMKQKWTAIGLTIVLVSLLLSRWPSAVHAEGPPTPESSSADTDLEELVAKFVRCTDIEGEQYCFAIGFIELEPGSPEWQEWLSAALAQEDSDTGDMSLATYLRSRACLSPEELRKLEEEELSRAHNAVWGIKLGNYLGKREPIPAGFFERHPSLAITEDSPQAVALRRSARTGEPLDLSVFHTPTEKEIQEESRIWETTQTSKDTTAREVDSYPPYYRYIIPDYYREQIKSYYCGPATMETFGDADGNQHDQYYWADKLDTETYKLTYIGNFIPVINDYTNWDAPYHGYSYAVVSVNGPGKNIDWFIAQHEIRIGIYGAPIVEHVLLHTDYFDYLRYDHDGHYQTGRGYSHVADTISIFEPFDEQDWCANGNHTGKHQQVAFQDMWNATYNHPQQNFGR